MTVPGRAPARFPGFDVLARQDEWDTTTAAVVVRRTGAGGPSRFLTGRRESAARALLDRLLAQDAEPRVPVFELVDARLADGDTDGWRYDTMPEDGEAWRRTLDALDADARSRGAASFAELSRDDQVAALEAVRTADGDWHELPAKRVWNLWMRYACAAFYSHPWAWNEIGFGGPAYPVGYHNLGVGGREHWEVAECDAADPEPWARRRDRAIERHGIRGGTPAGEEVEGA